jgi:hypothetical protein
MESEHQEHDDRYRRQAAKPHGVHPVEVPNAAGILAGDPRSSDRPSLPRQGTAPNLYTGVEVGGRGPRGPKINSRSKYPSEDAPTRPLVTTSA